MSNNKFKVCPPLMSDARMFTNYMPNKQFNDYVKMVNNIDSNIEYKNFLQSNGQEILKQQINFNLKNFTCNEMIEPTVTIEPLNSNVNFVNANHHSSDLLDSNDDSSM